VVLGRGAVGDGYPGVVENGLRIVLIASSALMIVLVLLHRSKGGGLSNLFGGGVSSSLGGSSVVEKNLDRLTIVIGAVWFLSIVGLGLLLQ
jgi:preprotein translocase subunit SecG